MNMETVKDEILNRMDMSDLSLTLGDMHDVMNMFDINEEQLGLAYNSVVNDQIKDMSNTSDYVMDYFREKGNSYPSFDTFKDEFEKDHQVSDDIVRQLYKKQIEDENQLSLFEIIKQEVYNVMKEERDFEKAAAKIMKKWGGGKTPEDKLNPEDLFGSESMAALGDIESEYGAEELAPFGTMEDPNQFVSDVTSEDVEVTPPGMIKVTDAEGNQIKRKLIVKPVSGIDKAGRVTGFGDDGKGNMIVLVDWQWPIDMKYSNPEEMGKDKVYPEDIVVRKPKMQESNINSKTSETMEINEQEFNEELKNIAESVELEEALKVLSESIEESMDESVEECMDEETINEEDHDDNDREEDEELDESGRGLGKGVKNSGDRNVKKRDDHHSAPLTNLNESIDNKINKLFEGSVKKKDLIKFVESEAKVYAENIKRAKGEL